MSERTEHAGAGGVPDATAPLPQVAPERRSAPPPPSGPLDGHTGTDVPDADVPRPSAADAAGRPQRRRTGALVASTAGLALLLGLGGGVAGAALWDRLGDGAVPSPASPVAGPVVAGDGDEADDLDGADDAGGAAPSRDPRSIAGVAEAVLPSVVSVEVETAQGPGSGSGFVIDESGLLLTNNHVIAGAAGPDAIDVVFVDGTTAPAELVGTTVRYDLAVLRVDRTDLEPLAFAPDDEVVVGDPVVAVGAPLGLQSTVTSGIISALDRPVTAGQDPQNASYINAVQTDAAINPGNSGGPLVDLQGRVVGINSAIAQLPSGLGGASGSIGLGFAIPAEQAVRTSQEIIETGEATYPVIGVVLDQAYTGQGVQIITGETPTGVPAVEPEGPAGRAGLEPGDVITALDGQPVTDNSEFIVAIGARRPGETVTLTVERGGETRDVQLVLDERVSG